MEGRRKRRQMVGPIFTACEPIGRHRSKLTKLERLFIFAGLAKSLKILEVLRPFTAS